MKTAIAAAFALAGFTFAAPPAGAAGCLSGGAIGAGAGHLAGHHAVWGGAASCAVGHHEAKARHERIQQQRGIDKTRAAGNTGPQN